MSNQSENSKPGSPNWGISSAAFDQGQSRKEVPGHEPWSPVLRPEDPQVTQWSLPFLDQLNTNCLRSGIFVLLGQRRKEN
jgi:hypothetical protein